MKNWLIKMLGGYTDPLTEAVKDQYNTIGKDDILKQVNEKWMVGDKVLDDAMKHLLIQEAKTITQMKLWEYLEKDIQYNSNLKMFNKSRTTDDMVFGKSWLWIIASIRSRVKSISEEDARPKEIEDIN